MSLQTHAVWLAAPATGATQSVSAVCMGVHAPFPILLRISMLGHNCKDTPPRGPWAGHSVALPTHMYQA